MPLPFVCCVCCTNYPLPFQINWSVELMIHCPFDPSLYLNWTPSKPFTAAVCTCTLWHTCLLVCWYDDPLPYISFQQAPCVSGVHPAVSGGLVQVLPHSGGRHSSPGSAASLGPHLQMWVPYITAKLKAARSAEVSFWVFTVLYSSLSDLRYTLVVLVMFLLSSVLCPVLWFLWIHAGSANANFFFAMTITYALAQVLL